MKKLFVVLSFTVVLLVAVAAASPSRQQLIGVWKIQTMEIKGVTMRHEQMGEPYIEFNDEGGFMIKLSSYSEKGRYTLKENNVTLRFLLPKKPAQKMSITRLDKTEMDYSTTDSTGEVKVKCFRITEGLSGEKD
jgi:hypothetical protein